MILNEMVHDARIIRIGGTHPPAHMKNWMGDSIGRWEGDTLVVETTNFTDKTQFRGSGENLKVIERFTRTPTETPPLPVHRRGSDDVGTSVDRRVPVDDVDRADLRIRLPRRELRAGRGAQGRTPPRVGGGEDPVSQPREGCLAVVIANTTAIVMATAAITWNICA